MTMNFHSPRTTPATRAVLWIAFLTIAFASTLPAANAAENPVLAGSGYEEIPVTTVDYPMLDGSGYERPATVRTNERETARTDDPASIGTVLDGSGYEASVTLAAHDWAKASIPEGDTPPPAASIDAVLDGSGYEVDSAMAMTAG